MVTEYPVHTADELVPISLVVNGIRREGSCSVRKLLIDFLREDLGLTGTHAGCEHGICGACTILIEGKASRSCITFAFQVSGLSLTTIEGLSNEGQMHPLQKAFMDKHALQCGFCTPGMLMTALDLLNENPMPNECQVKEALGSVICRCTGYQNIVDAVLSVAQQSNELPERKNKT